jgi:WD40 repeat protein
MDDRTAAPRVFISYARADTLLVDGLVAELIARGLDAHYDQAGDPLFIETGIAPGDSWRARLHELIVASDVIVFVLSPDSIASEICNWELEEACQLHKRIIPILGRAVDLQLIPRVLRELQISHGLVAVSHAAQITNVEFSPDGKSFLTASSDHTVRITHADSGRLISEFAGHADGINAAHFSHDGRLVVSASGDRWTYEGSSAREWQAIDGRELARRELVDCLCTARFADERASHVVMMDLLGCVEIWPVADEARVLTVHTSSLRLNICREDSTDPFGVHLPTSSGYVLQDNVGLVLWTIRSGQASIVPAAGGSDVICAATSPCGRWIAGGRPTGVRIWGRLDGTSVADLQSDIGSIIHVAFSADARRLIAVGKLGKAQVWDTDTRTSVRILEAAITDGERCDVPPALIAPDGKSVLIRSRHGSVELCDVETVNRWQLAAETGGHEPVLAAFSPDSSYVGVAHNSTCTIYETGTGRIRAVLAGHEAPITCLEFSKSSDTVLTGSADCTARIWRAWNRGTTPVIRGTSRRCEFPHRRRSCGGSLLGRHACDMGYHSLVYALEQRHDRRCDRSPASRPGSHSAIRTSRRSHARRPCRSFCGGPEALASAGGCSCSGN